MKSFTLVLMAIVIANLTYAQEKLSLSDAIQLGLQRNYDIRIENENVEVAENNNSLGEAGMYPTVNLSATSNNSVFNQEQGEQFFSGQTFPGFQLNNQQRRAITPQINANWTIFDGRKVWINKARLENMQSETEGNADIVVSNAVQAIILGYYLVVLEEERLEVFEDQLKISHDKYSYTKVRSELGSAVSSDLLLEEGNYLNDSVNYINQQLKYRDALRQLNFLIAEKDVDKDYAFSNELVDELQDVSYATLAERMENQNVDLRKQYLSQAIIKNNLDLARAERYPRLSVDLGYNWARNVQDLTNANYKNTAQPNDLPIEPSVSKTGTYYANFTLAFTLFNGNKINRAIKNAIIQEDIGNIRIEQLRSSINKDLADAYDQYQIRNKIYSINTRRVEAAKTNLSISEDKFKNGTVNSFDYRDVQNNYLNAALQEVESLYNIITSKITLMRLTGGILDTYAEE